MLEGASDFALISGVKTLYAFALIPAEKNHLISGERKPGGVGLVGSFAVGLRSHRDFIIHFITVKSGKR